jgi:hypothetical protein
LVREPSRKHQAWRLYEVEIKEKREVSAGS